MHKPRDYDYCSNYCYYSTILASTLDNKIYCCYSARLEDQVRGRSRGSCIRQRRGSIYQFEGKKPKLNTLTQMTVS